MKIKGIMYLVLSEGLHLLFTGDKRSPQTILGGTFSVYSGGFGKICSHSWDAFVLPTNMHGMWPQTGREGPGVERKVPALVKSQHENMIAPSAFSKVYAAFFVACCEVGEH